MALDNKKTLIQKIVNVFESGLPDGKYDALVIYDDGVNNSHQITYGRSQTTEQGNLRQLVEMYVENSGKYATDFVPYLEKIGSESLVDDENFKRLLKEAAQKDKIMKDTQDLFFDQFYWQPAVEFGKRNEFKLTLSMLVIYDSYIHSGSVPMFLRKRFKELTPVNGGDEKKWIESYVDVRHQWLKYHEKPILRKTIYRTQVFINEMERGNWNLEKLPIDVNGVKVK
jgi:chitosanase